MAELISFLGGIFLGYFAHMYRERFTRFGTKVKKAAEEELNK